MALFVHTKINKTIEYSGIEHTEKSSMGKNSKSGENHTWAALVVIALFSNSFVLLFTTILPLQTPIRTAPPSFPFLLYIYHPSRPKFLSKKENSLISFLLFFLFLNLPIKSNLLNFKFPSKTFQGESRLP